MGILMRKFDNDKFIEAKMDICMTEEELIKELKERSASVDVRGGIDGFMRIMERNDKYGR